MTEMTKMESNRLKAAYSAPDKKQTFVYQITTGNANDVESKISYLSQLRASAKKLQEDVNIFLTAKMEEDKARAVKDGSLSDIKRSRDEEEEANYGEEKVDED